jgi:hypothetical protein
MFFFWRKKRKPQAVKSDPYRLDNRYPMDVLMLTWSEHLTDLYPRILYLGESRPGEKPLQKSQQVPVDRYSLMLAALIWSCNGARGGGTRHLSALPPSPGAKRRLKIALQPEYLERAKTYIKEKDPALASLSWLESLPDMIYDVIACDYSQKVLKNKGNKKENNDKGKDKKDEKPAPPVRTCPGHDLWESLEAEDPKRPWSKAARQRAADARSALVIIAENEPLGAMMAKIYDDLDVCDAPPHADMTRSNQLYQGMAPYLWRLVGMRTAGALAPFQLVAMRDRLATKGGFFMGSIAGAMGLAPTILRRKQDPNQKQGGVDKNMSPRMYEMRIDRSEAKTLVEYIDQYPDRVVACGLTLAEPTMDPGTMHANMLFFYKTGDKGTDPVKVARFEPYLSVKVVTQSKVEPYIKDLVEALSPRFKYIDDPKKPHMDCLFIGTSHMVRNASRPQRLVQAAEQAKVQLTRLDPGGYCFTWSLLAAELVLRAWYKDDSQHGKSLCTMAGEAISPLVRISHDPLVLRKLAIDYQFARTLQCEVLFETRKKWGLSLGASAPWKVLADHYGEDGFPKGLKDAILDKHVKPSYSRARLSKWGARDQPLLLYLMKTRKNKLLVK